jgi:hypothetical protein
MAKTMGLSLRSVQRIWQAHQLQSHRLRTMTTTISATTPRSYSPRSACSTESSSADVWSATATWNSSACTTPSSARSGPRSRSTVLDKLCHRQASQSAGLAVPRSALDLSLHPDLRLLAECDRELLYPRSLANAFAAASSVRLSTSRPPSMLISPSTMPIPDASSGPSPPTRSVPNSAAYLYLLNPPEH